MTSATTPVGTTEPGSVQVNPWHFDKAENTTIGRTGQFVRHVVGNLPPSGSPALTRAAARHILCLSREA